MHNRLSAALRVFTDVRQHVRGMANPVDKHVGSRVRLRRIELAMTQEALADRLGLTSQQVQKYEKGTNRMAASRLHDISEVLRVPVAFFFEDLPGPKAVADVVARPLRTTARTEEPMTCRGCGCTNRHPCPGGCSWLSIEPPVCSACVERAAPNASFALLETRWLLTEFMASNLGRRLVEALSRIAEPDIRSSLVRLMIGIAEDRRPARKRKRRASQPE
jgi:transcriptional regulator with XRE-family HTH domain